MRPSAQVYELPLSKIKTSAFNVRKSGAMDGIVDLTSNVAKIGIKNPLVVHEYRRNNYEIISGQRRYIAAKRAGLKTAPCIIRKGADGTDMALESFSENLFRLELNMADKGKAARALLDTCGGDTKALAGMMGVSIATVRKYLDADDLPGDMGEYLSKGMNFSTAKKIYEKYPDDKGHRKDLADAYIRKSWGDKGAYHAAILDSGQGGTVGDVDKIFRVIKGSRTINIRLPSRDSTYVKRLARDKNMKPEHIAAELVAAGIEMHKRGMVMI